MLLFIWVCIYCVWMIIRSICKRIWEKIEDRQEYKNKKRLENKFIIPKARDKNHGLDNWWYLTGKIARTLHQDAMFTQYDQARRDELLKVTALDHGIRTMKIPTAGWCYILSISKEGLARPQYPSYWDTSRIIRQISRHPENPIKQTSNP